MRTTLNLAPEAAAKVRQLAEQRRQTLGAVASQLILRALEPKEAPQVRNGMPLLPVEVPADQERTIRDLDLVNRLRDQEP